VPLTDWCAWVGLCTSSPQQCRISTLIFDFFCGRGSLWISYEKYIKESKVLTHLGLQSKELAGPLTNWSTWVGFSTSSPLQGVKYQLWYLKFCLWRGSLWISNEKYIKDSKVLAHLGFQSNVLAGPLTDWSAWAGFCTSSPQQGVKYQLGYLIFFGGGLYKYPMQNILRTAKFLPTWGVNQWYCPDL
jgi:hypothetical protein